MTCEHEWQKLEGPEDRYRCLGCGALGHPKKKFVSHRRIIVPYICHNAACQEPATERRWGGLHETLWCALHAPKSVPK